MRQKAGIERGTISARQLSDLKKIRMMEVCGTHTMAISRYGIRDMVKQEIEFISGPGCPVCVTPAEYMDYIYELALEKDIVIATYGDMIRVPGTRMNHTLANAKILGAEVRMVYSVMDAVELAKKSPKKRVVFLGVGFETTAPATAIALQEAKEQNIENFYVLSMHKRVEPVMRSLLEDKEIKIDGFLCPGNVAAVLGTEGFLFLEEYSCPGVITGFSAEEIIDGITRLKNKIVHHQSGIENAYASIVKEKGNSRALSSLLQVFDIKEDLWRGIGIIPKSGYEINDKYKKYDIKKIYPMKFEVTARETQCRCGEILKGKEKPKDCKYFGAVCTPENPIGPCMVSSEGSCAAYYRYESL